MQERKKAGEEVSEKRGKEKDRKSLEGQSKDLQISKNTSSELSKLKSENEQKDDDFGPCTICDRKQFTSLEELKKHYTLLHPNETPQVQKKSEKKRIIVGNTSKFIPEKSRHDNTTHKWMIYIRGPPDDPNLSFVKMLKVYIDESYEPNHIIDLVQPPYHISRRGWGEFPYKVIVFFKNSEMNKPVEISHYLKLDKTQCGKDVLSPETHIDIELKHGKPQPKKEIKIESPVPTPKVEVKTEPPKKKVTKVVEKPEVILNEKEMIIKENAIKCPLITEKSMPYPVAKTEEQFQAWSLGKKKAIEKLRNNYLFDQVSQFNIKKREISEFLRNYPVQLLVESPEKKKKIEKKSKERIYEMPLPNDYCRICGAQHFSVEELEDCKKNNWDTIPYSVGNLERKCVQKKEFKVEKKKDLVKSLGEYVSSSKDEINFIQSILEPMKISINHKDDFEDKLAKAVFVKALESFIDNLINDSLSVFQSQKKDENEIKVFVPIHIYTSIMTIKEYMFLRKDE